MLFNSVIVEIVISLFFVYLLLSLICSALNEWLASYLFKLRSKTLRQGIENLLADPVLADLLKVSNLADTFYAHPLIDRLGRQETNVSRLARLFEPLGREGAGRPSYIPGRDFARAALDLLLRETGTPRPTNAAALYETVRTMLAKLANDGSDLARTLLILVEEAGIDPRKVQEAAQQLQEINAWRQKLRDFTAQTSSGADATAILKTISELERGLQQTEAELEAAWQKALANVEGYFDDAMARVSGWYKRRVQGYLIIFALVVTVLLNADTLALATELATNNALRAGVVKAAEQQVAETLAATTTITDIVTAQATSGIDQPATPPTATLTTTVAASTPSSANGESPTEARQQLRDNLNQLKALQNLGLPVGWQHWPQGGEWIMKIIGLLITTIAVSFGAPFWFELLNKLVNLRMAGRNPREAAAPK
ncbi:MAG: hypothetical protein ACOYNY_03640 [Caldilineaceae bacterium]